MFIGRLDRRVTIEAATVVRDSATGAEVKTWITQGTTIWAEVIESATANDERMQAGVAVFSRPTRVRCRYRSDIDATMRVRLENGKLLQILGIAQIGRKDGLEMACKEYAHE